MNPTICANSQCEFQPICAKQQPQKSDTTIDLPKQAESKSPNTIALNQLSDREYRDFFNHLAFEILECDIGNPNAYAMFIEAMWGGGESKHFLRIINIQPKSNTPMKI